MRKLTALFIALIMAVSMTACGKKQEASSTANVVNPMCEVTEEDISAVIGEIMLPAGAENTAYYTIDTEHKIYQINFSIDDVEYCYRVSDDTALTDTSGMYFEWKSEDVGSVDGRDATLNWIEGEEGIIYWYDYVPGLNYCLSMKSNASYDALLAMANNIFICVQGDAG